MKNSNFNSPFFHLRYWRLTLPTFSMTKACETPRILPSSLFPHRWVMVNGPWCVVNGKLASEKPLCVHLVNHLFIVCPSCFPVTFSGQRWLNFCPSVGATCLENLGVWDSHLFYNLFLSVFISRVLTTKYLLEIADFILFWFGFLTLPLYHTFNVEIKFQKMREV